MSTTNRLSPLWAKVGLKQSCKKDNNTNPVKKIIIFVANDKKFVTEVETSITITTLQKQTEKINKQLICKQEKKTKETNKQDLCIDCWC